MELILSMSGMLAHSFDKFYVVTKFILHTVNDLKFSTINFYETYDYLQEKNVYNKEVKNIFLILEHIVRK